MPAETFAKLVAQLPEFHWDGSWSPLSGGNLNFVWRLFGHPHPVIVKTAPGHALDPRRIWCEGDFLEALGPSGSLHGLAGGRVRTPQLLYRDDPTYTLVMEDVGPALDLKSWLWAGRPAARLSSWLGTFLAELHRRSWQSPQWLQTIGNPAMRQARLRIQYQAVGDWCGRAGLTDAVRLGQRAARLGERWLQPGHCLVMGDLWPMSILVPNHPAVGLYLIDWELADFGSPALDLGHFLAHLWMLHDCAPSRRIQGQVGRARWHFVQAYRRRAQSLLTVGLLQDCATHCGCEILMRCLGPFQSSSVYADLCPDSVPVRRAVDYAASLLRLEAGPHLLEAMALESQTSSGGMYSRSNWPVDCELSR